MKLMLSSLENCRYGKAADGVSTISMVDHLLSKGVRLKWNLMSYYYARHDMENAIKIRDNSIEIMIDSGAHSMQFGAKVDFEAYTKEYGEFIKAFDRPNVVGYFEMDVDNIIGYKKVLELRKLLETYSDKIIPVWHPNRGIEDFHKMCQDYAGKIVSITGFGNNEIKIEQYVMFLSYAKKYGCKLHCLGMTQKKVLENVPFDYVDSSSWKKYGIYGMVHGRKQKVSRDFSKTRYGEVEAANYIHFMKLQDHYYQKWRKVCKD